MMETSLALSLTSVPSYGTIYSGTQPSVRHARPHDSGGEQDLAGVGMGQLEHTMPSMEKTNVHPFHADINEENAN